MWIKFDPFRESCVLRVGEGGNETSGRRLCDEIGGLTDKADRLVLVMWLVTEKISLEQANVT